MTALPEATTPYTEVQLRYRDNFARHVMGVGLYLQSEIMQTLTRENGHGQLRINFEPYITLAGKQGIRLSDIADLLGISRQAANQTANQIETAGYLQREADPTDGRAKLLLVTPQGENLLQQGAAEAMRLQHELAILAGCEPLEAAGEQLRQLNDGLGLLAPANNLENRTLMAALLPRLADYINIRLMQLTMSRGHQGLKPSFGQVLTAIGPAGGRIQQIAATHDVSKQAISAIATELEQLGYIQRVPDSTDARQLVLHFTPRGEQLIADSVDAVDDLLEEFTQVIGKQAMAGLEATLGEIYRGLHLEEDIFSNGSDNRESIPTLARQLREQLGQTGARELAEILLAADNDKR